MQVALKAVRGDKRHTFNIVVRGDELVLTTPMGKEIASIKAETMEKDVQDEYGKYKTVETNNFYVFFVPAENTCGKDVGHAWVEAVTTDESR